MICMSSVNEVVLYVVLFIGNISYTGQAHGQEASPVVMVDELLILNPHKLSFSEAGLRIMITPHFSPRTRLSMAGRMLISEVFNAHILWRTHAQEKKKF